MPDAFQSTSLLFIFMEARLKIKCVLGQIID